MLALWMASASTENTVFLNTPRTIVRARSAYGHIEVEIYRSDRPDRNRSWGWFAYPAIAFRLNVTSLVAGFGFANKTYSHPGYNSEETFLVVPHWFLFIFFAALPTAFYFVSNRHRSIEGRNRCRACGYDLTGNTSGVCPECGAAVKASE